MTDASMLDKDNVWLSLRVEKDHVNLSRVENWPRVLIWWPFVLSNKLVSIFSCSLSVRSFFNICTFFVQHFSNKMSYHFYEHIWYFCLISLLLETSCNFVEVLLLILTFQFFFVFFCTRWPNETRLLYHFLKASSFCSAKHCLPLSVISTHVSLRPQ